jgi:hypothetical protein
MSNQKDRLIYGTVLITSKKAKPGMITALLEKVLGKCTTITSSPDDPYFDTIRDFCVKNDRTFQTTDMVDAVSDMFDVTLVVKDKTDGMAEISDKGVMFMVYV